MTRLRRPAALAAALLLAACRTAVDYPATGGPRHVSPVPAPGAATADSLRVVTFNIAFAREVDGAIALLATAPGLRGADVVLLQEMDAGATARIAGALGMGFVYYPAVRHRRTGRDFGNAILSRWPMEDDARLVLPHPSRYARTHRIATAATVRVGAERVRVYSTHLGTPLDIGGAARRRQLEAILADARPHARVIVGGDLNASAVGEAALAAGFGWPTRHGPRTTALGRWDHLFVRGLLADTSGTLADVGKVSDHKPVWIVARW